MVPNINNVPTENSVSEKSYFLNYPKHIDTGFNLVEAWLDSKKEDDGAEGLWRIHGKLYDFTEWIPLHPGGSDWLQISKVKFH